MATHQSVLTSTRTFSPLSEVATMWQTDSAAHKLKLRSFHKSAHLWVHSADFHPSVNYAWHRDSLWDSSFPFHSSISDDLIIIADSFNLALLTLTNPCPTRYSDMAGESNSVIDLMFLCYRSSELDNHSIYPKNQLSSDHASLFIDIPIFEEAIHTSKFSIPPKSD